MQNPSVIFVRSYLSGPLFAPLERARLNPLSLKDSIPNARILITHDDESIHDFWGTSPETRATRLAEGLLVNLAQLLREDGIVSVRHPTFAEHSLTSL